VAAKTEQPTGNKRGDNERRRRTYTNKERGNREEKNDGVKTQE